MQHKLALNSWSSYLSFPNAGITGVYTVPSLLQAVYV
jgi:hypothetical protein